MPRTVSASEAKVRLGEMMTWAETSQDDVIIESRGKPRAVIMTYEAYQTIVELRESARREEALARLEALRDRVAGRNRDLTADEAAALADRLARDVAADMTRDGTVDYGGAS